MESIVLNGVVVDDTNIIHDSTKELFRSPLGAVVCGTEIELGIRVDGIDVESVTLCLFDTARPSEPLRFVGGEKDKSTELNAANAENPLRFVGGEKDKSTGLRRLFAVSFTVPDTSCVFWYWFEIRLRGGGLLYYGAEPPYASGLGRIYLNPPPGFQITVYDAGFETPDWAKSAVMYQVFPDRFCMGNEDGVRAGVEYHRSRGRTEFELHGNWEDMPVYEAKEGQKYYMPADIFGGDLEGIRQRLPYLKELGVTLLYLNPIFEAASNHRYNTGDYLKIDPILGDADAFRKLAAEAKGAGIRIILDGVFSHTGDDSLYFNKYGRYDGEGAYQSRDSKYYSWFKFEEFPKRYSSWWGFETLPEVDEDDPGWQDYIITTRDSVVRHWLGEGASGYRLDVADELPDGIIEMIRAAVKETDPEAFLLGEVWEDATTKQSYGRQRSYALGRGLDAVMNYPFLNKTIDFLMNRTDARHYCGFLAHQRHTYPAPMYFTLMNLVSSHDVSRIRTRLGSGAEPGDMTREEQARFALSEEEFLLGGLRQRLAAAIQFSLPGIPSIYYGDENGMTGMLDPFNRRAFREEDAGIAEWYHMLAGLRRSHPVMSTGDVRFFPTDGSVLGILRYAAGGRDFFGNELPADAVLTVVNPVNERRRVVFELGSFIASSRWFRVADSEEQTRRSTVDLSFSPPTNRRGLSVRATGVPQEPPPLLDGLAEIDMMPLSAEIYRFTDE